MGFTIETRNFNNYELLSLHFIIVFKVSIILPKYISSLSGQVNCGFRVFILYLCYFYFIYIYWYPYQMMLCRLTVTRRVSLVKQELLTLLEHPSSP